MTKEFVKMTTSENRVISLISLAKNLKGVYPTADEINAGLKKLNIERTDKLISTIKEVFPAIELSLI